MQVFMFNKISTSKAQLQPLQIIKKGNFLIHDIGSLNMYT